ncbi:MAG TPA: riboflavin synthase [Candidatus Baltobacterales bacterium]|nr:riboflavin synthase [Candidatus Baltobacterales bacterium]
MFTGIVSSVGTVVAAGPSRIGVAAASATRRLKIGSSVAVNGCCLTVVERKGDIFFADVVPETLRRTNLGLATAGSRVNLELPLSASGLLDGHLVQGHVDARGKVRKVVAAASGRELEIGLPAALRRFVVEKGSVAVDGMSLTVAGVDERARTFRVALIPHTLAVTIAGGYVKGSVLNLEADVVARYVARNLRR